MCKIYIFYVYCITLLFWINILSPMSNIFSFVFPFITTDLSNCYSVDIVISEYIRILLSVLKIHSIFIYKHISKCKINNNHSQILFSVMTDKISPA